MSNIQPAYTKILAQDDSTSVTGHLANIEYIAVRQVGYLGLTSVTTCLACASNWRGFSTNALLVGDKTGGKYLLVSITDTAIDRERVVVYKLVPQNNTWVHLTIADWFSDFKGVYRFKKWVLGVNDGSRLVATGQFDAMDSSIHIEDYPRTVVVDLENSDSESTDQTNSQTTGEATKPTTEGTSTNEQFNEDSTMQTDKSKSTNSLNSTKGNKTMSNLQPNQIKFVNNDKDTIVSKDKTVTVKFQKAVLTISEDYVVRANVYTRHPANGTWVFMQTLLEVPAVNAFHGYSGAVSDDGSTIAIGLPFNHRHHRSGRVGIYHRAPGSINWEPSHSIVPPDRCWKMFGKVVGFFSNDVIRIEYNDGFQDFPVFPPTIPSVWVTSEWLKLSYETPCESTKPTIKGTIMNEQFNEDSTMQADKSKSTNGGYTLLELQKHADRVKVSRNGDIAVTVVKRLSHINGSSTRVVVDIFEIDAGEDGFYRQVQGFSFELTSRSRNSIAVNEDGSIIAIGLPSHGTNGHGEVRIWCRTPGSVGWKAWGVLDNGGKKIFGRNVGFDRKGVLQVEYDIGYAYFDALSGLPLNDTQQQTDSDEFLEALKKKKEETSKLHKEGEEKIILLKVKSTELEQEIDLLNNLIELYSKKKR